MNKINCYFVIIVLLALLPACTEEIDMDLKSGGPKLIVDGILTDRYADHFVTLSVSSDFFNNEPNPAVSNANVTLSDGELEISLDEIGGSPGVYLIPKSYRGIYGKTYTLRISGVDVDADGVEESYEASNTLKPVTDIDGVGLKWSTDQGVKTWEVLLYAKEPEETVNFYAFVVYVNGELITPKISETECIKDKFFNGNNVDGAWVQSVEEEDSDGEVTDHVLKLGDWVKLEMQEINEDYYYFIDAVHLETGIQVPLFSGPPANVPTNVSNGGVGFFRTYSVTQDSVQVTQEILDLRDK